MNQSYLQLFYADEPVRETVKAFMLTELNDMAVEAVFAKKPVEGMAEAKELVERVFDKLKELYAPKDKPVIESSR